MKQFKGKNMSKRALNIVYRATKMNIPRRRITVLDGNAYGTDGIRIHKTCTSLENGHYIKEGRDFVKTSDTDRGSTVLQMENYIELPEWNSCEFKGVYSKTEDPPAMGDFARFTVDGIDIFIFEEYRQDAIKSSGKAYGAVYSAAIMNGMNMIRIETSLVSAYIVHNMVELKELEEVNDVKKR